MHFSETCDEDLPPLITHVSTTSAPIPDRQALPDIHAALEQRALLPEQQRARCRIHRCRIDGQGFESLSSRSSWSHRQRLSRAGHANTTGMLSRISRLTGSTNKLTVRKGRPAAVGRPPGHAIRKSSRSSLVLLSAGLVQSVHCVRKTGDEVSLCGDKKRTLL